MFQSPRGKEKKERNDRREKNVHHPRLHLLQAQFALVLLLSKFVGCPGTESLPSTIAPPPTVRKRNVLHKLIAVLENPTFFLLIVLFCILNTRVYSKQNKSGGLLNLFGKPREIPVFLATMGWKVQPMVKK